MKKEIFAGLKDGDLLVVIFLAKIVEVRTCSTGYIVAKLVKVFCFWCLQRL
jgi:hypothetical protein